MNKPRVKHYTKQQEEMFWRLTGVYGNGKVFTIWEEVENQFGKKASDSRDWKALIQVNNDLRAVIHRFETELGILILAKFNNGRWERHFCVTQRQAEEKSIQHSKRAINSIVRASQIIQVAQGPKYGLPPDNPTQKIVPILTGKLPEANRRKIEAIKYLNTYRTCSNCQSRIDDLHFKFCPYCTAKL